MGIAAQLGVLDHRFLARSVGLLNPPPPLTLSHDAPVRTALELLKQHRVGSLVVVDDQGSIAGIFTERDVVLKFILSDIDIDQTPISALMTPEPHSEQMTCTMAYALNMMSLGGYRHIPLVDDDNMPIGVISVKDIVDYIVGQLTKDIVNFKAASR